MAESGKPRIIGINHIALEVGDIEEALAFYGRVFTFELRAPRPRTLGPRARSLAEGRMIRGARLL
jgi:catechol 2,3-dioxygenase-like lactoylglutathione lyase family enzyme